MVPRALTLLLALTLAACAPRPAPLPQPRPDWAFQTSDLAPDPAYRFGKLPNGMRYIIRHNATPAGTAQVRLDVAAGSLDEAPDERGFAHFIEHMAFNGSTRVPEGEMIRLLERNGLSFGADTNAATGFEQTLYKLDLPRNDPVLLDTALMLLRETASELTIAPAAVDRERGVVLAELRDGRGFQRDNLEHQLGFFYPRATYPKRLPIGTVATLQAATAPALRAFWAREYVPANATVIVVGDFDAGAVEQAIRHHFETWQATPPAPRPDQGRVDRHQRAATTVWTDPALSERVTISRHGKWLVEPDTAINRRRNLLRQIGYGIVNRRFQRLSRRVDPPFRGAGFGTSEVFRIGRTTNLIVDTVDGGWQRGVAVAGAELTRALRDGFTRAEVDEQLANLRTSFENGAAAENTRGNSALVAAALALVRDDDVPTTPRSALGRFNAFAPSITPKAVLAALRTEAVALSDPLIRFQGRTPPAGGTAALRATWTRSTHANGRSEAIPPSKPFAYSDFGPPGSVVSDVTEPALGIRELRFANGVRLNLKRTTLESDRIQWRINLDGGDMLASRDNPLATEMMAMFGAGGLGQHSQDDLQTLLAGRSVGGTLASGPDVFSAGDTTTPRDLDLQMHFLAAMVTDPGYRPEGEVLYRQNIANFFASYRSTPTSALTAALGGLLSDDDPRFTLQSPAAYQALRFDALRATVADRLAHGAIEIGLVGDLDEEQAIAAVARTFGALPPREPDFRAWDAQRVRPFAATRGARVIRHLGKDNQAIVRMVWPTRDDADPVATQTLGLLQEVAGIEVLDTVREALGKAYSPSAQSSLSRVWHGYGTFAVQASVDVADLAETRAALVRTIRALIDRPVDADVLARARAPMLDRLDNALKSNAGWLSLVDRAQTRPDYIARYVAARARLSALTAADLQSAARRYLTPESAVEVLVLPEGVPAPADRPAVTTVSEP